MKENLLHPRSLHGGRYNFAELCGSSPELADYVIPNPMGDKTIDFTDAAAVVALNKAILFHYYNIESWDIPAGYLCPPIPGRADYIHYLADILAEENLGELPRGKGIRVLDIGTGTSCIYPIIGSRSYGWKFIAVDADPVAVKSARRIVEDNEGLNKLIKVVHQKNDKYILKDIIRENDSFDLTMCNPPFHKSIAQAEAGNKRKWKNLNKNAKGSKLNFGGQGTELCFPGGEMAFVAQMIAESRDVKQNVGWFTSLVSNGDNIPPLKKLIEEYGTSQIKVVKMAQGQKSSRFIAWSFKNL